MGWLLLSSPLEANQHTPHCNTVILALERPPESGLISICHIYGPGDSALCLGIGGWSLGAGVGVTGDWSRSGNSQGGEAGNYTRTQYQVLSFCGKYRLFFKDL